MKNIILTEKQYLTLLTAAQAGAYAVASAAREAESAKQENFAKYLNETNDQLNYALGYAGESAIQFQNKP